VGILGANLSERFRLVRDIVVFLISVYALYNIVNFYTKGYLDGIKTGIKMNAPIAENVLKETICYQTPNCTLYCNEVKYEKEVVNYNNSGFPVGYQYVLKEVNRYCLNDLGDRKFMLLGE
jgi:Pyruvate/2-oxoacid:ferredoxin oxidoreductase delta subunit